MSSQVARAFREKWDLGGLEPAQMQDSNPRAGRVLTS